MRLRLTCVMTKRYARLTPSGPLRIRKLIKHQARRRCPEGMSTQVLKLLHGAGQLPKGRTGCGPRSPAPGSLDPRPLAEHSDVPTDLAAQRLRGRVSLPHRRQVTGIKELSERPDVNLVSLDLRLGDDTGLERIDTTTSPARLAGNPAITAVFFVASRARRSERRGAPASSPGRSGDVGTPHTPLTRPFSQMAAWPKSQCTSRPTRLPITFPPILRVLEGEATGGIDNNQSAVPAHPDEPQGRRLTNADSRPFAYTGLPGLHLPWDPLRMVAPYTVELSSLRGAGRPCDQECPASFIPRSNPIEPAFSTVRLRTRITRGSGSAKGGPDHGVQAARPKPRCQAAPEIAPLVEPGPASSTASWMKGDRPEQCRTKPQAGVRRCLRDKSIHNQCQLLPDPAKPGVRHDP